MGKHKLIYLNIKDILSIEKITDSQGEYFRIYMRNGIYPIEVSSKDLDDCIGNITNMLALKSLLVRWEQNDEG